MNAAVAYLRRIRTTRGISQKALAAAMKLSPRQVNRWETTGTEAINAEAFVRAVKFLDASLEQVAGLILDEQATPEEGEARADVWLSGPLHHQTLQEFLVSQLLEHLDQRLEPLEDSMTQIRHHLLRSEAQSGIDVGGEVEGNQIRAEEKPEASEKRSIGNSHRAKRHKRNDQ